MAAPPDARKQRLTAELVDAELALDAKTRTLAPGMMRTQLEVAGWRAKVLGLRAELVRIEASNAIGEKRQELRAEHRELLLGIKEAELSARAASKQATEDDLPILMARLNAADEMQTAISELH